MSLYFLSIPPKKLSQSITSSSYSFKLNNIKSWKRNALGVTINLASSDFGTTAYGCLRNDTGTKIEIFEFDPATIASASITILKRGLDFNGDLTTQTTNYKLDWSANETTVQLGTDVPQLFQYLKEYVDSSIIAGAVPASTTAAGLVVEASQAEVNAFTDTKVVSSVTYKLIATPAKLQATTANKGIVRLSTAPVSAAEPIAVGDNDLRVANASTTAYGIVEEATQAEVDAGTATGGTGARLFVNPSTATRVIVQTYNLVDSPATWTKVTGLKYIEVRLWAAGASGSRHANAGGGGGGGAYNEMTFSASQLGATETITIGAGGAAITGSSDGNVGGNSSFGSLITVYGGAAGIASGGNGGGGGGIESAGSVGTGGEPFGGASGATAGTSIFGGGGIDTDSAGNGGRTVYGGGAGGTGGTAGTGGNGGKSTYGGGGGAGGGQTASGSGGVSVFSGAGGSNSSVDGTTPSGGGAGAYTNKASSGKGGDGRVIVHEFY